MIKPSEFKTLITLKSYTYTKVTGAGLQRSLADTVTAWAKWENLSGSTAPNQAQMMSDISARVTLRYNPAFSMNWVVEFDGQEYTIKFIKVDDESYKRFMIIDLGVSINQTSWS